MNCQDNSRLKVPLPEFCKTTDIGCVPATDGKPDCPPEADQLPLAYDINSQTLWIFSCESRNWTPLTKFSLAELQEVSLDNLRNICNLVNVPVFYNLGQGTIQGSLSLGELAEKIAECRGITPGPTPAEDKNDITVVEAGENVTVSSNKVGDVTTYTVNAVIPAPSVDKNDITVVEAGSNTTVTSNKVGNVTTYTVSATGGSAPVGGSLYYRTKSWGYPNGETISLGNRTVDYTSFARVIVDRVNKQVTAVNVEASYSATPQTGQPWKIEVTNPFDHPALMRIDFATYIGLRGVAFPVSSDKSLKDTSIEYYQVFHPNPDVPLTSVRPPVGTFEMEGWAHNSMILPVTDAEGTIPPSAEHGQFPYLSSHFNVTRVLTANETMVMYLIGWTILRTVDRFSSLTYGTDTIYTVTIHPHTLNVEQGTGPGL